MNPVIERVFDAIIRVDSEFNIKFISDNGVSWLGLSEPHKKKSFFEITHTDDHEILKSSVKNLPQSFDCYVRALISGNVSTWVCLRASMMPVINQYVICILDISNYTSSDSSLLHAAEHDSLTQLPNRAKLTRVINELIEAKKKSFTVALLDLDGFKKVNDTLGHLAGDQVLIETATRLLKSVDVNKDTVSRLGGDEFVIVLNNDEGERRIDSVMSKVLYSIARPYTAEGKDAYLGCSIGVANFPQHGSSYAEILKNADSAMYISKNNGKNRVTRYTSSLESGEFSIKSAIHIGIQEGEFYMEYQPLYDINKKMVAAEALMRWNNRTLGKVSPDQFIAVAEEAGLMIYLGEWALRYCCHQIKEMHKYDPNFMVSINVSAVQFSDDDFHDMVNRVLDETKIDSTKLILEITESTPMSSIEKAEGILYSLRERGVRFAIDDFGKGYSSISYLTRLPVSFIKVDKTYVQAIEDGSSSTMTMENKLVKAMVSLAHSIDLSCVAEGVETDEQYKYLKAVGYDYLQGFLLSESISFDQIISLLKEEI